MSDSIKIFITGTIEYITNAEICQIHKTAQTRTACLGVSLARRQMDATNAVMLVRACGTLSTSVRRGRRFTWDAP